MTNLFFLLIMIEKFQRTPSSGKVLQINGKIEKQTDFYYDEWG